MRQCWPEVRCAALHCSLRQLESLVRRLVFFQRATDLAYSIAEEADIWTQGFRNIWGSLVRTWLEALIPEDAVRLCNSSRLHVVVLEVPFVRVSFQCSL